MNHTGDPEQPVTLLDTARDDAESAVAIGSITRMVTIGIVSVAAAAVMVLVVVEVLTAEPRVIGDSMSVPTIVAPVSTTTATSPSAPSADGTPTSTTAVADSLAGPAVAAFEDSEDLFATHPTDTTLVLWTFDDPRLVVLELDEGRTSTIDLAPLGIDVINRIEAVGGRLAVERREGVRWVGLDGSFGDLTLARVEVWGDDEVWVTPPYVGNAAVVPSRVTFDDSTDLPEVPSRSGPFGFVDDRLLVGGGDSGGVFAHEGDRYVRISDGGLIASGSMAMLVRVCDDELACLMRRVGHDGSSTEHEIPNGFDVDGLWWLDRPASPTIDAYLGVSSVFNRPVLWDLDSGEIVVIPVSQGRGAAWSAAGDWLFLGGVDEVVAFHLPTRSEVRVPVQADVDLSESMQVVAVASN